MSYDPNTRPGFTGFHPSSGPVDPLYRQLPQNTPHSGIERSKALRRAWLTQTRELGQVRSEPDFDELEEAFDDEVPFDPPVHLPNLLLLLLDLCLYSKTHIQKSFFFA